MKSIKFQRYVFLACFLSFASSALAQLTFTTGVNPSAGPNADYAAAQFYNFSNGGGQDGFAVGTGGNLNDGNLTVTWQRTTYNMAFTYEPGQGFDEVIVFGKTGTIGENITIPTIPPTDLQVLVGNSGIGDLTLSLTSINSVANGGVFQANQVVGGTENFASGTTWSAANGAALQAYLDSPTLFSSGFTLNGTITLDALPNSANYGDNLNSLVQFNLASVPEPSTWALLVSGAGLLGVIRQRR